MSNSHVKDVLNQIEESSEFYFLFSNKLVNVERKVDINVNNATIQDILSDLFVDTNIKYKVFDRQIILSTDELLKAESIQAVKTAQQQPLVITGKITDTEGNPLPGANVIIERTGTGTITNPDGEFRLEVDDPNITLIVSFIGYIPQRLQLDGRTSVDISLEQDIMRLEEVVYVGYGTKRKATVTGSIATVEGAELQKTASTNLAKSLTGQMTGVVVNTRGSAPGTEKIDINIRGKGSWRDGDPLIIIDGIANRTGFEKLDPNAIESISVLKDASAAIYGSRAANGVILITTKRGLQGKPTIEYSGDYGLTQPVRIPDYSRSWQYATYYTEAQRSGFIFTDEEIAKFKAGTDQNLYPNYDLSDYILQEFAPETNHTVALRGGTDIIRYYVSGRYRYQDSFAKDGIDDFNSYSILSNLDAQIHENFSLAFNISGRRDDLVRAEGSGFTQAGGDIDVGWFEAYLTDPTKPIYYENGLPAELFSTNTAERIKGMGGQHDETSSTINSQLTARWDLPFITEGLFLEGTGAYDLINTKTKDFYKSYDLYSYDNATGEYINQNKTPVQDRSLYDYYFNSNQYTLTGKLGYERTFGNHDVNAFLGYEQYSVNTEWINATRTTFLSPSIPYLFAGDPNTQKNDGSASEFAYRNVFGRMAYNYSDKYMFDFTLRRDESLKFPKDNRVGWFPGVSVGWRLSEESFVDDNLNFVNDLKLRASWGQMGSDNVAAYQYLATAALEGSFGSMVFGSNPPAVTSTLYFTGTPNPFIQWEVANTTNVGLEGALWNNMLGFEIEYFYSKRSNILTPRNASVPFYTGMSLPDENIGKAKNQGIELMLKHNRRFGDFSYRINGNFTYVTNEIIFMDESPNVPDYQRKEGHPIDSWLLYKTDGIFNNQAELEETLVKRPGAQVGDIKYIDVNEDGSIDDLDRIRVYESPIPKMIYGLNLDFQYRGFELSMLWQGQADAKTYINPTMRNGDINIPVWMYEGRWTPDNQDAELPRAFYHRSETYNTLYSDFWLFDASFLRLRNLEISYNLSGNILNNTFLERARIYVSGFNLLLFDKIKHYDPEVVNELGVFYPATRVYNVGVKVSF